jgi:hypothetical protein
MTGPVVGDTVQYCPSVGEWSDGRAWGAMVTDVMTSEGVTLVSLFVIPPHGAGRADYKQRVVDFETWEARGRPAELPYWRPRPQ